MSDAVLHDSAPGPRLVSFLGTGRRDPETGAYRPYDPAVYALNGKSSSQTPWVVIALSELLALADPEIVVLATPTAKEHTLPRLETALADAKLPAPTVVDFPEAGAETLWQQFNIVKNVLRAKNREVILDITHGFRSFPFFAAAVAGFVRAVDETAIPLRIVYGAFDAPRGQGEPAPIWDLTAFVELLDWAREIMLFLRTGRAAEVSARTRALDRALSRSWIDAGNDPARRPRLDRIADALHEFGADLETIRTGALLLGDGRRPGSAARLRDCLAAGRDAVDAHAPPLADILKHVDTISAPVASAGPSLDTASGQQALAALATLYYRMGRYAEAATIVREGWITRYAEPSASVPGRPEFDADARAAAKETWRDREYNASRDVARLRNDINHGGFRKQPMASKDLARQIGELVERYAEPPLPVRGGRDGSPPAENSRVFLNISNHPSDDWCETQRGAALSYAPRIEDLRFPAVPPEISPAEFDALLDATLAKVPDRATHAMIQGEFTMTFALVKALQGKGITCLAATGDRDVEDQGGSASLRRFRFVRFREFPR